MKKSLFVLSMLCAAVLSAVELPKPLLDFPLNEGDFNAIKNLGTAAVTVKVTHPEQMQWGEGPDGKALFIDSPLESGDKQRGGIQFAMPKGFDLSKPFSLSMMVRVGKEGPKRATMAVMRYANGMAKAGGLSILVSWNMFWFRGGVQGSHVDIQNNPNEKAIHADTWYRFAAVYDGKTAIIYLDGKEAKRAEMKIEQPKSYQPFIIGGSGDGYTYGFRGSVCRFKFFDQALTPEQVAALQMEK